MSVVSFTAIEDAIHDWVVAASGLAAERVIWKNQGGDLPETGAYVTMRATARPIGRGWLVYSDNDGGGAGEELVEKHVSQVDLRVELQAFDGDPTGGARGTNLLLTCRSAAQTTNIRAALRSAGWSPARWDSIEDISQIAGGNDGVVFEPRAITSCYGVCKAVYTSTATYIEFVELTNELTTPYEQLTIDLLNETVS